MSETEADASRVGQVITNKSMVERYGENYWWAALGIRLGYALLFMLTATCLFGAVTAGGKPRAEACRATGANYLATICAICKANLPEVMKHHKVACEVGQ